MEGNRSGTTFEIYITKVYRWWYTYLPYISSSFPSHSNSILSEKKNHNGSFGFSLPPTSRLSNGDGFVARAGRIICSSEKSERLSGFAVGREKIE